MITKTPRSASAKRPVMGGTSITSGIKARSATPITAATKLSPAQAAFVSQIQRNVKKPIMGATNTTNIMARPDFLELLPLFVQKLYILDVFGSVAMKSRQQLIPYFKFVAENTKGETKAGDVLSSPFVNNLGKDRYFGSRVIKNETVADDILMYTPVLPGSVTISATISAAVTKIIDDGAGDLKDAAGNTVGSINYATGALTFTSTATGVTATYQYDNENVGPRALPDDQNGHYGYEYGAQMGKGYLQLDEFNLVAEAHQLACYWSIYSAFAANTEYGGNLEEIAKEAAFAELTAEINSQGFFELRKAATVQPQFNWDASPVLSGAVAAPSDYLNMFKLKLNQASNSVYQATRLSVPNRLIVGSNVAAYISMINSFVAEGETDNVGPYKLGKLDQFEIYVDPNYDPNEWVMACKSADIRRNSALFGEYMPLVNTDPIGLANASVQQGYATMYGMKIVNPQTVVSGRILGTF